MKKVMLLAALFLGTTVMVNAQTEPKAAPAKEVKAVNGTLISIWHNTFLGTDKKFKGWREIYEQFFNEVAGQTEAARPD